MYKLYHLFIFKISLLEFVQLDDITAFSYLEFRKDICFIFQYTRTVFAKSV